MFKVSTYEVSMLKDVFASIAKIVEEGIIKIEKEKGLVFSAADKAMVSVVRVNILPTVFEEFEGEDTEVGINVDEFASLLKRGTKRDKLTLTLEKNRLNIILENGAYRKFELPTLTITESELPNIDQLEPNFKAKAEIKSDVFKQILDDAKQVGDEIEIYTDGNSLKFGCTGELSSVEVVLTREREGLLGLEVSEPSRARYAIDYLSALARVTKVADIAILQWATDFPIKITFRETDRIIFEFVVAPRTIE